ncbi:MAG: hypothetical protein ABH881_01015 [bacterium]
MKRLDNLADIIFIATRTILVIVLISLFVAVPAYPLWNWFAPILGTKTITFGYLWSISFSVWSVIILAAIFSFVNGSPPRWNSG